MDDVDDWLDAAAAELRRLRAADDRQYPEPARQPARQPSYQEPTYQQPAYQQPAYEQADNHRAAYQPAGAPVVAAPVPEPPGPPVPAAARPAHATAATRANTAVEPEPAVRQPARSHRRQEPRPVAQVPTPTTGLHHVEIWVRDLDTATRSFGWLFERLGWTLFQVWENGRSWRAPGDGPYVVLERSPDLRWQPYDRTAPGLNHLALAVPQRWMVDRIVSEAPMYGWRLLFPDRHPYAGGAQHYAAYLENGEGFEAEVVAP
ncbi:MAG: VOC family protein [Jiangellaceae bacterium]|nr:VOC family protein [Jiangellaceae bacterium]